MAQDGSERKLTAATAAAQRTIEEVRRLLDETSDGEQLANRVREVQQRLRASMDAIEDAVGHAVSEGMAHLPQSVEDEIADAERRIRENPLRAVAIAAGIGLLVGLLLRRR